MENPIHEEKYKGLTIKIFTDMNASNPRENDNLATMLCKKGNRNGLGDDHGLDLDEIKAFIERKDVISLPLYVYEHGGITMKTGTSNPFSCPWDSGLAGYIAVTKQRVKEEMARPGKLRKDGINHELHPIKVITKKDLERVYDMLRGEVKEYDDYLTRNVYGYVIEEEDGTHVDSCWGFYGDYNGKEYGALREARGYVDSVTHNGTETPEGQVKLPLEEVAAKPIERN